jgi:hypothetical protein
VGRVVIGMDPHKRSATIEVLDADEQPLLAGRLGANREGYRLLLAAGRAVPGTGVGGRGLPGCGPASGTTPGRRPRAGRGRAGEAVGAGAGVLHRAEPQDRATDAHSIAVVALRTRSLRQVRLEPIHPDTAADLHEWWSRLSESNRRPIHYERLRSLLLTCSLARDLRRRLSAVRGTSRGLRPSCGLSADRPLCGPAPRRRRARVQLVGVKAGRRPSRSDAVGGLDAGQLYSTMTAPRGGVDRSRARSPSCSVSRSPPSADVWWGCAVEGDGGRLIRDAT